jgi:phosphoglycolate phosphatase
VAAQAVIFDLDGTILNTLPSLAESLNAVLLEHQLPTLKLESVKAIIGDGILKLIERALPPSKRQEGLAISLKADFKTQYSLRQFNQCSPYKGIINLLSALKARGLKLAVLSNKDQENVSVLIDRFFPKTFSLALGASPARPPKPSPEGALEIISSFKVNSSHVCYLGDGETDMLLASRLGFKALGAAWGYRAKENLIKNGAQAILEAPKELLNFLD